MQQRNFELAEKNPKRKALFDTVPNFSRNTISWFTSRFDHTGMNQNLVLLASLQPPSFCIINQADF